MADSEVEVVRAQFEAVNRRDFEHAMSLYAEDVVLVVHDDAFLDAGRFEGKGAVGKWFGDWFATFEPGYRFDIQDARMVGDYVFLDAAHRGHGRSSGIEVGGRTGYLYEVRDGLVARVELFREPEDALRAAGGT